MEPESQASPVPAPTSPTSQVPATWPGAWGIFKPSREAVRANFWPILGLVVLSILTSAISSRKSDASVLDLVSFLLSIWLSLALTLALLTGARGEKLALVDALKKVLPQYLKGLGVVILTVIFSALSILALVIPAFIVIPRISLALYYVVDKNLGPMEAIKASWRDTKGSLAKLWGIIGVTVLFSVLILLVVGIYFVFMYQAASAILYLYLTSTKASQPPTPVETEAAVAEAPAPTETV